MASINPFVVTSPRTLYANPDIQSAQWWRAHGSDLRAKQLRGLAATPQALWVGGGDIGGWVSGHVAAAAVAGQVPLFAAYNIVLRDLDGPSAGGETSVSAYLAWAQRFAKGIGGKPAVVIVEPDSIIHMAVLNAQQQTARLQCLNGFISTFTTYAPSTTLYLDAGDGRFNPPEMVAPWLLKAGIGKTRGFAVNVSNFNTTSVCSVFSRSLIAVLRAQGLSGDIGFVIDTSRNGSGPPTDAVINADEQWWCNPAGRTLGNPPTVANAVGADALLWIKNPGDSDGPCGTSMKTGFQPELALALIAGT